MVKREKHNFVFGKKEKKRSVVSPTRSCSYIDFNQTRVGIKNHTLWQNTGTWGKKMHFTRSWHKTSFSTPSLYTAVVDKILLGCYSTLYYLHVLWITRFPLKATTGYMVLKSALKMQSSSWSTRPKDKSENKTIKCDFLKTSNSWYRNDLMTINFRLKQKC